MDSDQGEHISAGNWAEWTALVQHSMKTGPSVSASIDDTQEQFSRDHINLFKFQILDEHSKALFCCPSIPFGCCQNW